MEIDALQAAPANTSLKLHRYQKIVVNDKHRFRVVVAGRRWGKTQVAKISIIRAAASKCNQLVWYVAPTYLQARDIMWDDLKMSIPRAWIAAINEQRMTIRLINGSRIALKGADKPDSLRGVGLHFLVIDEAQDVKKEAWEMILQPTLATTNGRALFIGTPKAFNWLYDIYMLGQRGDIIKDRRGRMVPNEWMSWQFPTITSPFIPRREIEARRRDMDPRTFKQEFEACHLPETEVLMFDGRREQIQNVKVGDFVAHLSDEGKTVPAEVIKIGVTGEKTICDVTLETGETVSASAHHKFKVYRDAA